MKFFQIWLSPKSWGLRKISKFSKSPERWTFSVLEYFSSVDKILFGRKSFFLKWPEKFQNFLSHQEFGLSRIFSSWNISPKSWGLRKILKVPRTLDFGIFSSWNILQVLKFYCWSEIVFFLKNYLKNILGKKIVWIFLNIFQVSKILDLAKIEKFVLVQFSNIPKMKSGGIARVECFKNNFWQKLNLSNPVSMNYGSNKLNAANPSLGPRSLSQL